MTASLHAQEWNAPVRGSWIAGPQEGVSLSIGDLVADIVVSEDAHSSVKQAAEFLAQDIEKIIDQRPDIVSVMPDDKPYIRLATWGEDDVPDNEEFQVLEGKWEAHKIKTIDQSVWLVGANPRGTAFAAYTLSKRLGIDPLYHWTGYTPEKHETLRIKEIDYSADEPTFKYRGLFHDDEDILAIERDEKYGWPVGSGGTVPSEWYERFFETSLRLRMNMVAPFTRTRRPYEVRKTASDWGLHYTSHHYDILLSNPYGYERFDLAEERGIEGPYSWFENPEGIKKYWEAGVEENIELNCIWPVGLRGTEDHSHKFAEGTTQAEKNEAFLDVIRTQVAMARKQFPEDKEPVFHFTMWGEMFGILKSGIPDLPEEVIFIWPDDTDGGMGVLNHLPENTGKMKHGIYYHLAYWGPMRKQTTHTITPQKIEEEFRKVIDSGATEYMLNNVSELREYIMNTRFIAEICWDAETAFKEPDAAGRFTEWWCREYFGDAAADDAVTTYNNYFDIIHSYDQIWQGALALDQAIYWSHFHEYTPGRITFTQPEVAELIEKVHQRALRYDEVFEVAERAESHMNEEQARFFHDNALLGMLIDYRPTQAADIAFQRMMTQTSGPKYMIPFLKEAVMQPLKQLDDEVRQSEWGHFKDWYQETSMRKKKSVENPRYSYYQLKEFLKID
ncbi:glycosyl hydrolase 115 family protein [Rubellicoccus peritrichatus]|uniref:Glycosyl hydrolase 115 family protein n=1 Tax=Rubellicoccus peritrichatus TaxID=3080537 RepID=A0AAQ3L7W2_9BACT|nr:glycosyl hydrolase 115 family protein [Puniceicoccus sp. CR14]WOO40571.1 glycosyl hydrolase 115 family protein [Puniceicoccus sp. CR14]